MGEVLGIENPGATFYQESKSHQVDNGPVDRPMTYKVHDVLLGMFAGK